MSQEEVTQIVRESERRRRSLRPSLKVLLPTAAALGAGAAIAVAAIPGGGGVITGCYLTNTKAVNELRIGALRVIDTSLPLTVVGNAGVNPAASCLSDEATVTWDQQGPQGPPGTIGQQGPAGQDGANGSVLVGDTAFGIKASGKVFLKLDGVKGESTDKSHKDDIDISSFSIGAANPNIGSQSSGAGAGKVTFNAFSITKKVDKASPVLLQAVSTGKHITSGQISFARKAGGKQQDYLVFKFKEILVSSLKLDGQGTNPSEQVTFNFQKLTETFQGFDAKGQKIAPVTMTIAVDSTVKLR